MGQAGGGAGGGLRPAPNMTMTGRRAGAGAKAPGLVATGATAPLDGARRSKRGDEEARQVPDDMQERVRALVAETGPILQSRFLHVWSARYPDAGFEYTAWGFERLGSALKAVPDIAFVGRRAGVAVTVLPAAGRTGEEGARLERSTRQGLQGMDGRRSASAGEAMREELAATIALEARADANEVKSFLAQPCLRFTIDCLVSEFLKFQERAADGKASPPLPPPPPSP